MWVNARAWISKRTKSDLGTPILPSGPGMAADASAIGGLNELTATLALSSVCVSACGTVAVESHAAENSKANKRHAPARKRRNSWFDVRC
jgi:hypothetical protein